MVCEDISQGQESNPIPVTNLIDNPPLAPEGEMYVNDFCMVSNYFDCRLTYLSFFFFFSIFCGGGCVRAGFTYIKSIQAGSNVKIPRNGPGCNCKESCTNPKTCSCAKLNNNDFPYVGQDGGRFDLYT